MISSALAARYASALADVVTGPGSDVRPDQAVEQLRAFENVFASSRELENALVSPAVPPVSMTGIASLAGTAVARLARICSIAPQAARIAPVHIAFAVVVGKS